MLPAQKLHREPRRARLFVDACGDDLDDVLALDGRADADLLREALPTARIGGDRRQHDFDRAGLPKLHDQVVNERAMLSVRAFKSRSRRSWKLKHRFMTAPLMATFATQRQSYICQEWALTFATGGGSGRR